jgi:hypothetical protein
MKNNMNLIAISGKMQSGKNTVASIINKLTNNKYEEKCFADKLKDIVCLLIGCTREQLEDQEFKKQEMSEEWWYKNVYDAGWNKKWTKESVDYPTSTSAESHIVKTTYRQFLQNLGTEAMRDGLHTNVWVNALFADYHPTPNKSMEESFMEQFVTGRSEIHYKLPNWIITDMRFPNELKAVKDKGGISIRVNRPYTTVINGNGIPATFNHNQFHESETALDSAEFDFVIENFGSIEELIEKVKIILIELKVI